MTHLLIVSDQLEQHQCGVQCHQAAGLHREYEVDSRQDGRSVCSQNGRELKCVCATAQRGWPRDYRYCESSHECRWSSADICSANWQLLHQVKCSPDTFSHTWLLQLLSDFRLFCHRKHHLWNYMENQMNVSFKVFVVIMGWFACKLCLSFLQLICLLTLFLFSLYQNFDNYP